MSKGNWKVQVRLREELELRLKRRARQLKTKPATVAHDILERDLMAVDTALADGEKQVTTARAPKNGEHKFTKLPKPGATPAPAKSGGNGRRFPYDR